VAILCRKGLKTSLFLMWSACEPSNNKSQQLFIGCK